MIRTGTVIENPVTGERIVFRKTSRDTGGQAVVIETFLQPDAFVAAAHVHPSQEERFEVLRGVVGFKIGGEKIVAGPGRRITVPAGTVSRWPCPATVFSRPILKPTSPTRTSKRSSWLGCTCAAATKPFGCT